MHTLIVRILSSMTCSSLFIIVIRWRLCVTFELVCDIKCSDIRASMWQWVKWHWDSYVTVNEVTLWLLCDSEWSDIRDSYVTVREVTLWLLCDSAWSDIRDSYVTVNEVTLGILMWQWVKRHCDSSVSEVTLGLVCDSECDMWHCHNARLAKGL